LPGADILHEVSEADSKTPATDHPLEWRSFIRECRGRKNFPVALAPAFEQNKEDLFHVWRKNGKDWDKCQLLIDRRAEKVTESKGKKQMVKVRTLVNEGMPLKKAEALKERRKSQGLCYEDPDFPGDKDEELFWHTVEISSTELNRTTEGMGVSGQQALDQAELEELTGSGGILAAGLRAAAPMVCDKHSASFAESMTNMISTDDTGKLKLTLKKDKVVTTSEPRQANDTVKIANALCDSVLAEIKEASGFELVLTAKKVCAESAGEMKSHVVKLRAQYDALNDVINTNSNDPNDYLDVMEKIEPRVSNIYIYILH